MVDSEGGRKKREKKRKKKKKRKGKRENKSRDKRKDKTIHRPSTDQSAVIIRSTQGHHLPQIDGIMIE